VCGEANWRKCHLGLGRVVAKRLPAILTTGSDSHATAAVSCPGSWPAVLLASARSPCGGGAGLGWDRLRADQVVRWRALGRARARAALGRARARAARPGRRRPEAGDEGQSRDGPRDLDAGFQWPASWKEW
jgi:hypothetical protein